MSIRTWKAEFYPNDAYAFREGTGVAADIIRHSLRKWQGLRKEALAKHGVEYNGYYVSASGERSALDIDSDTCSLCVAYFDSDEDGVGCDQCPLYQHLGERCDYNAFSPYSIACRTHDVEPMIAALEAILLKEETK